MATCDKVVHYSVGAYCAELFVSLSINWRRTDYTDKMNRVHLVTFQHDNPCSACNVSTRLDVSILIIALILLLFNTDRRVKEYVQAC